jgi:acylphosphatase
MKVRAHILVTGDVQGVFFRSGTRSEAHLREVTGWVRNLPDGRVEAVFEGEKDNVEGMVEFCRRGPPGSRVDDVDVSWEKPGHKHKGFEIRVD